MPFFSFSINSYCNLLNEYNIKPNQVYFSKNKYIWKILNKEKKTSSIILNREVRKKIHQSGHRVLFCLPPSIGLGDSIEYARALKALHDSKIKKKIGIAFTEDFSFIFRDYFNLNNLYPYIIPSEIIKKYDSLFHFTLEIDSLKNQKNIRSNIEKEIKKYFKINNQAFSFLNKESKIAVKKISIFPISASPIRTMPINILEELLDFLKRHFLVEIFLDKNSEISNFILSCINLTDVKIIDSKNKKELLKKINEIDYGIFMDSGPLHVAKLFNKRGILIESSVSEKKLLDKNNIVAIKNTYSSQYCKSPCGLTDIFNLNGLYGCYDSLKINQKENIKNNSFLTYQRRGAKNNYLTYIKNPVGCLRSLDIQNIINYIKKDLLL